MPDDPCTKTGRPVIKVLREKHPDLREPDLESEDNISFEKYPCFPDPVPVQCDGLNVENIAKTLGRAAGLDSIDEAMAKVMLLNYGRASARLREVLVWLAEWLANTSPPFAAYWGLLTRSMCALDKEPGT